MFLDHDSKMQMYEQYVRANKRLLLLDYDGTLVPFAQSPEAAKPDDSLLSLLQHLCGKQQNEVFIISGRDSVRLEKWLGHLPVNLIAEHGAKVKLNGFWKNDPHIQSDENWKEIVYPVMQQHVRRCSNTFVEEKEFSMVWHFRNAESQQGKIRASELYAELSLVTNHLNVQVVAGNKIIEVRIKGIDKGYIVRHLLKENDYDFIFACGADNTDEDMFKALAKNKKAFTIKIGDVASYAKYNLYTPQMVVSLLNYFHGAVI